jgi:hypothetical protein
MSKEQIKTQIDTDITNKTSVKSISPSNVGGNMKNVVDLIPDVKTNGTVLAVSGSKATLQYDINNVNKSGGSEVKLPTTIEVGKEVLFLASNYAGAVSVYVNDAGDIKLSGGANGISGNQQSLQINANEAYRFIYRTDNYWYFEKIIDIPTNLYQLQSERTTDGTLVTNSNFKYPTEQAVKTYVDAKDSRPYKIYTAILFQNGTNSPTAIVLENTYGVNFNWSRTGIGNYKVSNSEGVFVNEKTISFFNNSDDQRSISSFYDSINDYYVSQFLINSSGDPNISPFDGFYKAMIEIRTYN